MERIPRLVCTPSSDLAFAAAVQSALNALPPDLDEHDALDWLRAELRRAYPDAAVRAQEPLARIGPDDVVWYVSRRTYPSRIDTSMSVDLPRALAFQLYVERVQDWQTAVRLTPLKVSAAIVGNEYEASYAFLGRHFRGRFRVLAADPPSSVVVEATGSGVQVWYRTTFTEAGGATLVTVKGDYALPDGLIPRMADRLFLERAINRDIERANEAFVALCAAWIRRNAPPGAARAGRPESLHAPPSVTAALVSEQFEDHSSGNAAPD
jgi:hypothetical protein